MKDKLIYILGGLLILAIGFIAYQNFISADRHSHAASDSAESTQLWTCGMHPDIATEEPGNCPICGMKLTPVKNDASAQSGERKILYWVAPMDPNEIYDQPGKSKMGMDLVPVYSDEAGQAGVVTIDPEVQQNMNVKIDTIEERALDPSIVTSASFFVDERNEYQINARVSGWLEKLEVNFVGQSIKEDDLLYEIYSPELVAAQQEYLTAIKYQNKVAATTFASSGQELVNNAYQKLRLLNMSPAEIIRLENSGEVKTRVPFYSPVTGTVMMKNVLEGEKISAGKNILHIADLTNLWLKADIYESDLKFIKIGNKVTLKVDAYPGEEFLGTVRFIYPTIDPKTRVAQVRIDVPNSNLKLKPAMLANATIHAKKTEANPVIPESAVIRSGQQNVAVQYLGEGKFKPVKVELGDYAEGYYQILSGIESGNKVVTSAQFLIDSESSLKTAMKNFGKSESAGTNQNMNSVDSTLIRKGVIDLKTIDNNGDGKVYQDPMDWNVISDEPGRCPICEMNLVEVTLSKAYENLVKNGFQAEQVDAQQKSKNEMEKKSTEKSKMHDHKLGENEYGVDSPLIRTGVIDVKSIDKNNDGKLFECPMDWNILADEYHCCPVCEMKMKEYSLDEVKTNLKKHGYEYR